MIRVGFGESSITVGTEHDVQETGEDTTRNTTLETHHTQSNIILLPFVYTLTHVYPLYLFTNFKNETD